MVKTKKLKDISKKLNNIQINENKFSTLFGNNKYLGHHWLEDSLFRLDELDEEEKLLFIMILDSTSFSYWGEPNWKIEFDGELINGARGMILALRRAVHNGLLKLEADFLKELTRENYRKILKGTSEIPLFEERYQILKLLGRVLEEEFGGKVSNIIKEGKKDALKIVEVLIDKFPYFKDSSNFEGEVIEFNKKAQLFVLDVFRVFKGKGLEKIKNVDKMSACADYKLPQILRKVGIFEYSKELSEMIDNYVPLPKDSLEEIEIRLKTILVVEMMKEKFGYESYEINDMIWLVSQNTTSKDLPYHRTRTTKY